MSPSSPDVVGELVGIRAWRIAGGLLWSLYRPVAWLPGRPVRAECMSAQPAGVFALIPPPAHLAPSVGCRCGLYAAFSGAEGPGRYPEAEHMFESLLGLPRGLHEGLVLGEVSGWGTTELYTRGYRSEWQAVRAIFATDEVSGAVADCYDVPLVSV